MRKPHLTILLLAAFLLSGCFEDATEIKAPPSPPFTGGTLSKELVLDETGVEFQATDALDGSSFGATNGGIWYDDSEGKFKKVQDGSVTDLDTTGSGNLGSNLSSSSNDITTDNDVIQLIGTAEDLDVEFGTNSIDITTDTGVTEIDFIGIALKDDGVALITGAANTIDSDQYVDGSIDNAHLADDAVDSDEIASGAIDLDHMSANSVDSDQYVDGSVDAIHLAADVVDETKIADNGIDSEHYNDDSIDDAHINWGSGAGQVDADDIGDGSTNAIPTLTQETNWDTAYGWGDHGSAGYESATSNDIDPDRLAGDTDDDNLIDASLIDINGATAETNIAADDKVLIYDTSGTAVKAMTRGNFVSGIGAGQSVTFDIGDDGGNDSTDLGEIATENDTNSIVTLDDTDKMLIDMGQNWPAADLADTVTVSDDESTNDAHELVFTTDNATLESDGTATYNPSTGIITATGFAGALTGNVTGEASAVGNDGCALTTDTTGNYVASITNGTGITGGDGGSEGAALTIAATLGTDIAAAEMADGDHGDFTYSSNVATLDDNVVAAAELADMDLGDVVINTGAAVVPNFSLDEDSTVTDNIAIIFGANSDWNIEYDETTDDRLEFVNIAGTNGDSNIYWDLNDGADSTFIITNSDGTGEANLDVEGDITATGFISDAADGDRYLSLNNNTSGNQPTASTVSEGMYAYETDLYTVAGDSILSMLDSATGDIFWYGATDDNGFEYQIDLTDPTADRTITFDDNNVDLSHTTEDYVLKYNATTRTWSGEADSTGSALGSNLSSSTNDIVSDNDQISLEGSSEDIDLDFTNNTVTVTTDSGVTLFDFGGLGIGGASLDLSEGNITNAGSIQIDAIVADGTNVVFGSEAATQLQFRDSAVYVASLDDGHLDLEADTSIDLNAPVNIGGNTDMGDFDIASVDKLEGVDNAVFIDLGADGIAQIAADTGIHLDASDETLIVADGGANLINVTSDTGVATVDFGTINVKTDQFESDISTGTAPLVVASTTVVTNLNADMLDGHDTGYFEVAGAAAALQADDLVTLSGVALGATHLGAFTGTTISDNGTIKAGMQELETAVEAAAGTDDQKIDVSELDGTTLKISLEGDGEATKEIDLSSLQDGTGTDDQNAGEVSCTDEFDSSDATNVQDVLDDLDAAISGGGTTLKDLVTTSPLAGGTNDILPGADSDVTISIADAAADGATKGAAAFVANDFTSSSGLIGLDYTNAQKADTDNIGFLTDTDWDTFNGKIGTADVDDTPVNGETAVPVSSNWAYDHAAAADPHTGYLRESELGTGVETASGVNAGAAGGFPIIRAKGSVAFNPSSIPSGDCSSAVDGGTATGVATTDVIIWNPSGDPESLTGYAPDTDGGLYIWAYPAADHVYFKACNNTADAIDPDSITINWMVMDY
jgi:hypothetical protein